MNLRHVMTRLAQALHWITNAAIVLGYVLAGGFAAAVAGAIFAASSSEPAQAVRSASAFLALGAGAGLLFGIRRCMSRTPRQS